MSRTDLNLTSPIPPLYIIRGQQEPASYQEQMIPEYMDNPLIEALPPILTRDEVVEKLAYFPSYSKKQCELPAQIRLQLIENAREFFIPQGVHLEIEIKISCMLRRGLMTRNPMSWGYWREFNSRIESLHQNHAARRCMRSKARGFAIVGIGGIGKSTTVENILALYPQVIVHTRYREQDFILKQIVWLKLDCPRDGSTKSLCEHFFLVVDDILGTSYYERYVGNSSRKHNTNVLLLHMARVAALHCLGLLVIDEIQDLSAAKSGGAAMMLNFFVNLENTIGVPFILIGTPKARHLFSGEFRQARRASEQGDINWKRMDERVRKSDEEIAKELKETNGEEVSEFKIDPVWAEYVKELWVYQYVKKTVKLESDLLNDKRVHALYDESQGITAVAATLFLLAQRRAIATGTETITSGLIRTVARDSQDLISDKINDLKKGCRYDSSAICDDLDVPFDACEASFSNRGQVPESIAKASGGSANPSRPSAAVQPISVDPAPDEHIPLSNTPSSKKSKTIRSPKKQSQIKHSRSALQTNLNNNIGTRSSEDSFPVSKYIKPANEFLDKKRKR
jgi:hypothetical protein